MHTNKQQHVNKSLFAAAVAISPPDEFIKSNLYLYNTIF